MKHFLPALLLLLAACAKPCDDMPVTHPRYSFIRINEEGYNEAPCGFNAPNKCLPVNELTDLQFQLITDFEQQTASIARRIIAVPCDAGYSQQDIYEMAFGTESKQLIGSSDNGGLLRLGFASNFNNLQVGDYVNIGNACTAGGAHNYTGIYQVTAIDTDTFRVTVNTPFNGFIVDDCDGGNVYVIAYRTDTYLIGSSSTELAEDAEFEGENYAWNIATLYYNALTHGEGECFSLCVYKVIAEYNTPGTLPDLSSVTLLGYTNCFKKTNELCYTTKLTYGCNESSFGFYGSDFEMSVRLPFYLKNPQYPGEEKGYQKSDGTFLKLSERVNKSWEIETNYMPDEWHERLRIALSCDTIEVTNENANLTDTGIYRSEAYEIEWAENYPMAKAKTKVMKRQLIASVNSNCNT